MSQEFALVDRTEDYTPDFRAGRDFLELWSVDLNGRTIGVVRKLATSCWSASVYDGKFRNGFAKHRRLGDVDTKEGAFELVRSFYLERISPEGQLATAREIIASLSLWIDPAMKPRPGENAKDLLAEARAFMFPDAFGPDKYTAPYMAPDGSYVRTDTKITKDNLPVGPHWDEDGACFTAELDNPALTGCEWRWVPRNLKAVEKWVPNKELWPFAPLVVKDPKP